MQKSVVQKFLHTWRPIRNKKITATLRISEYRLKEVRRKKVIIQIERSSEEESNYFILKAILP